MKMKPALAIVGIIVGLLIALQIRSYAGVEALLTRDANQSDVLNTIYVLKTANESLKSDISALEEQLAQYSDQTLAYNALLAEIEKNETLVGLKPISGPGIELTIDESLELAWMIDLTNELWASGAEAVSVNGMRVTDLSNGFQMLNNLMLFDGKIVEAPYTFQAIGDFDVLGEILNQPGGILARLKAAHPQSNATLTQMEQISMPIAE